MGCHLTWRVDLDGFIPAFKVNRIEEPNLLEPHHMSKVPAHQNVHICYGCQRNMKHIVAEPGCQDTTRLIHGCQIHCFITDSQKLRSQPEKLGILHADGFRRGADFRSDHIGEHRAEMPTPEVFHEAIRPWSKLNVEATANDRGVDIDAENFHTHKST